jgi:hypothetical protein
MNFKPIEITYHQPEMSLGDRIRQFKGFPIYAATLCAMKNAARSHFHSMMAKGEIKSVPKVYVGIDGANHAIIHTPLYTHHCEECEFLGQYAVADLYLHKGDLTTLSARFSNDPSDYESAPAWGYMPFSVYTSEAQRRAIEHGLLKRETL